MSEAARGNITSRPSSSTRRSRRERRVAECLGTGFNLAPEEPPCLAIDQITDLECGISQCLRPDVAVPVQFPRRTRDYFRERRERAECIRRC